MTHKEYRYIYPALPLLMIPIAAGIDRVIGRLYPTSSVALALTLTAIAGTSLVVGAGRNFRPHFFRHYGETKALQIVRDSPDACGVALHLVHWGETPFYTTLHRDIPVFDGYRDADLERVRDAANYVLSRVPLSGYTEIERWMEGDDPLYLYRRDGGCSNALFVERLQRDQRSSWNDSSSN